MSQVPSQLGHWPKVIRAEEHLAAVRAEIDFWRELDVCSAIGQFESDSEYVIRVEDRIPVPVRLSILIGEVAGNLRAALDHQAFALVAKFDPSRAADPDRAKGISYPIFESATWTDKKGQVRPVSFGSVSRLPSFVETVIKDNQPYSRGDDAPRHPLAVINRLANTDKHRTLLLSSTIFTNGGMFGVSAPNSPVYLRSEMVYGAFKPGAEVVRFPLTIEEVRAAGCDSSDDMKVQAYAAAGVALNEPEMDPSR